MASRLLLSLLVAVLLAPLFALDVSAQPATCPDPAELQASDLLGLWHARFEDGGPGATLLLEPNPRWAGSLSGAINRNGERGRLAGDIDEGALTLEESADGRRIDAAWIGQVAPGSCGREIRGQWKADSAASGRSFVLMRP